MELGGGVHLSIINTFLKSLAPTKSGKFCQEKKRSLSCFTNYYQIPSATQVRSHRNMCISVLCVISYGAVLNAIDVETRINTRLIWDSGMGVGVALQAGKWFL